jgi:hypothetical protein
MTYQEFKNIEYNVDKEEDFYCWVNACSKPREEDKIKYDYYQRKAEKIAKFKKEAITKALKNIPKDYFD